MKNIFSINGLTKQYKSFDISNICFSCPEGSIMGLIGPNGAGKTTTIKAMMGLLNINAGDIGIFGKKIKDIKETYLHGDYYYGFGGNHWRKLSHRCKGNDRNRKISGAGSEFV